MYIDWSNILNLLFLLLQVLCLVVYVFCFVFVFWRGFLNELDIFCYRRCWLPMGPIVR